MENNIANADTTTGGGGIIGTLGDLVGIKGNEKTKGTDSDQYQKQEINNLKKLIEERDRQRDREIQQEKERQIARDAAQDKVLAELKQYLIQQEQRQIQQEHNNKQEQAISELKNRLDRQAEKERDANEQKQNESIAALDAAREKQEKEFNLFKTKFEKEYEQLQKDRLEKQLNEHTNKKNQEERLRILAECLETKKQVCCQPQPCQPPQECLTIRKLICCQLQPCQDCD
ncbi:MAG: hypothetical protein V4471_03290 [Pseudomonadota bacterium]